jgi:uncharacterized protein (TIGR02145 family)
LTKTTAACFVCGNDITINHLVANGVAPVDKTVTYGTVSGVAGEPTKCWITKNLGADQQAGSVSDASELSAGWYWQFDRKQGYKHDGTTRTPDTWNAGTPTTGDWLAANDPCILELGNGWRLPTNQEWTNVDAPGGVQSWTNWNGPYNSPLKMHASGYLDPTGGNLFDRGGTTGRGYYWSSNYKSSPPNPSNGLDLTFTSTSCNPNQASKNTGMTIRCIRTP